MSNRTIIIVSFSVDTEKEVEFNDFYHHHYIPKLMSVVPEIESARRYQEHNVDGNLRYYNKQFLTIYECASEEDAQKAIQAIQTTLYASTPSLGWKFW